MKPSVAGAILAGGRGSRIGGAKAQTRLTAQPLIAHVADALRREVDALAVVGDEGAAAFLAASFVKDAASTAPGPLAGVIAALEWGQAIGARWVAICPCDTPFLPERFVSRLLDGAGEARLAFAQTAGGRHPLVSIWRPELQACLKAAFRRAHPAMGEAMGLLHARPVRFEDETDFLNVNTPADLARARALLIERSRGRLPPRPRSQ